ncbi:hypothetical protein FG379_003627 [Cryptosporidium bovis]|uniref:uncharacterized protein n=1 Tax=Cryptosporidium bovis TaxID=310047 RepID=UPI003519E39D|nr:hypothetical protein FG379_003627 [Cryptosporidium bovis]
MNKKTGLKGELKLFGRDIKQWIDLKISENKFNGKNVYGESSFRENSNKTVNTSCKKSRQCGICMNDLVVFGIDFSLKCLHAICWCCMLRLRFLLKNKECPFCKKMIEYAYITSNSVYFDYIMDGSIGSSSKGDGDNINSENSDFSVMLKHPKEKDMDNDLFSDIYKVYYESYACKWYLEKILEYRCWYPNCRPDYIRYIETGNENEPLYKDIRSLGEHLFQKHRVRCCHVCIEKRKTMLLPEHFLFAIKDIKRHMIKGEMHLKPPILPHISCPICRVWCLDKEDFSDHVKNEHFSCTICEEKENSILNERGNKQRSNAELESELDNDDERNSDGIPRITYVYKDYASLQLHWKKKHYPCEHENCMFIVFENESELLFHRATHHSAADRRGNITVPIAVTSYRQQTQRRLVDDSGCGVPTSSSTPSNYTTAPLSHSNLGSTDISQVLNTPTPSLYSLDESSNESLSKMSKDKSILWRSMLTNDLSKCIQIVRDDLAIQLGLEEKCRDLGKWSLNTINRLYINNEMIPRMIRKIGSGYLNGEISPRLFITEIILLLWGGSFNVGKSGNVGTLKEIKREFKSISTSPNAIKYYFSPIHEPILVTLDGNNNGGKKIPSQFIDRILIKETDWSVLSSDIASMLLASLILGLPKMNNRKELLDSLILVRDEIQTQKLYIVTKKNKDVSSSDHNRTLMERGTTDGHIPRFKFGSLENQLTFEGLSIIDEGNEDIDGDINKVGNKEDTRNAKVVEKKYVIFEKLIRPEDIIISSKITFLESIYSFLNICWPKIQDKFLLNKENHENYILVENERNKIRDEFKLLNFSQTITEISALSSLYQHTSNIVTSANTIERILGLRAPYYRLAAGSNNGSYRKIEGLDTDFSCKEGNEKPTSKNDGGRMETYKGAIGSDIILSKQWLNICSKALNKICIYDIEIIHIYCKSCMETLCDSNYILKEKNRELSLRNGDVFGETASSIGESSNDHLPRVVSASSGVISHKTPGNSAVSYIGSNNNIYNGIAGVNSNSVKLTGNLGTGNNWSKVNTHSFYNSSAPKTVFASSGQVISHPQTTLSSVVKKTNISSNSSNDDIKSHNNKNFVSSCNTPSPNTPDVKNPNNFPSLPVKIENNKNTKTKRENAPKWRCMLCTNMNPGYRSRCAICSTKK